MMRGPRRGCVRQWTRRPERRTIALADHVECPSRQALAGIRLAHAVQHEAARRESIAEHQREPLTAVPLVLPERAALPFVFRLRLTRRERRLAADPDLEAG